MCPSIDKTRPTLGTTTKPRVTVQPSSNPAAKPVAKGDSLSLSSQALSKERLKLLLDGPIPPAPSQPTGVDWETHHRACTDALIRTLRQDEAVSQGLKNWKNLPTDLRMQVGKRISDIQASIFGFTSAPLRVGEGQYHGGYTAGIIDVGPKSMVSAKEFLDTVVHEQNHEFQHEKGIDGFHKKLAPDDPYKAIAKTWLDNFDDYITPAEGVKAYYAQPIEAQSTAMGNEVARAVMSKP